jgi:hypothetical protein
MLLTYNIKYPTACDYAFRKIQKEGAVDCFKLLGLKFPSTYYGDKQGGLSLNRNYNS